MTTSLRGMGTSGWELYEVWYYPGKSCDHKHCDSGDIVFLICHVTHREHMLKRLCEFSHGESPPCHVWYPLV